MKDMVMYLMREGAKVDTHHERFYVDIGVAAKACQITIREIAETLEG